MKTNPAGAGGSDGKRAARVRLPDGETEAARSAGLEAEVAVEMVEAEAAPA